MEAALLLTDDTLDLGRYLRLLTAMGNVHDAADDLFKPFTEELAALGYESAERQRVEWIEEDLKSLGRSFQSTSSSATENLGVTSIADCLGAIYVLEGSTLGGQIIAPVVARTLSLTPPTGCRYYIGYGPETGPRWKATRATIEGYAARAGDRESAIENMIAAAKRAFGAILAEAKAQRALPSSSE